MYMINTSVSRNVNNPEKKRNSYEEDKIRSLSTQIKHLLC